jgi:Fe2+ or Zn2+ uptake regulation protein
VSYFENFEKFLVKLILTTIEREGVISFKLLSRIKNQNISIDQTQLYLTLKALKELGCIKKYNAPEDDE